MKGLDPLSAESNNGYVVSSFLVGSGGKNASLLFRSKSRLCVAIAALAAAFLLSQTDSSSRYRSGATVNRRRLD